MNNNEMKFEDALKRLNEIVRALENGDTPLDDSIALFEEGIELSKKCTVILETAEQKVRFLKDANAECLNDE